jgi:putative membrane protein
MKTILIRTTSVFMLLAMSFVPVFAHHGTQFLNKAMEANLAELKLGEMAQMKAQNPRVKDFAAMVVKDHTMALDKMQMLLNERNTANAPGVKSGTTTKKTTTMDWRQMKINTAHQQTYDKLSKLSGAEFDRQFITLMTTEHQNAIREFETHIRSHGNAPAATRQKPRDPNAKADYAQDTDTIAFAQETLPTLRHHLEQAQMIQKDMKGGTPVSKR